MTPEKVQIHRLTDYEIIPRGSSIRIAGDELVYDPFTPASSGEIQIFADSNRTFFKRIINERNVKSVRILPLTHNQKALWFLHKANPNIISYNVGVAGKIKAPFHTDIFIKALKLLTSRHILLRTIFCEIETPQVNPCQIVLDQVSPVIQEIDASKYSSEETIARITEKYRIPFDFKENLLLRTYIFHGNSFTYFLFNIHHIICDAWSLKILIRELFEIYDSLMKGKEPDLKPIESDYGDYIYYINEFLQGESGKKQLSFWTDLLKDHSYPLLLPCDFNRPEIQTSNGATHYFNVSDDTFRDINKIADRINVTPNAILFTIFELLLSKLSSQKKFNIGIPASARKKQEFNHVFGHFINVLPFVCSLNDKMSLTQYILENKSKFTSTFENQDIPFLLLVENILPQRDPSRSPVFQVMYNFMNRRTLGSLLDLLDPSSTKIKSFGSLEVYPVRINDQEGQFELTLEILHNTNEFFCALKYNTDLFKADTIRKFESEFRQLLNILIKDPEYVPEWLKGLPDAAKEAKKSIIIKIAGTFTVEPVNSSLAFWIREMNFMPEIECSGYNQILQQLINPSSAFNMNSEGWNIALIRSEDWIKDKHTTVNDPDFSRQMEELEAAVFTSARFNKKGRIILAFCPCSNNSISNKVLHNQIIDLENRIIQSFQLVSNIITISSQELIETYSVYDYYEPLGEEHGHIPYKEDFFISLATSLARKINPFRSCPIKAIIVDCDNTIWQGVAGEINPKELVIAEPEKEFQKFLVEQYAAGILICLCSKNNENDVFEVFSRNSSMILQKEHIAFHRINWKSKTENIISLSQEINIGTDSFVFIDDNPMECQEVKANLPNIITILKPENGLFTEYLRNSWIFDHLKTTEEDKIRARYYREESHRKNLRLSFISFKDFIRNLKINIVISGVEPADIPRISQLTYRSNQFNFTTIRRDESEICSLIEDSDYQIYKVQVSDRFGDYGIVGVIIIRKTDSFTLDTFLLSCRVLGKGVEHKLISYFGQKSRESGFDQLIIYFQKTERNLPAQEFLESNFSDYKQLSDGRWLYRILVNSAINLRYNHEKYDEQDRMKTIPESLNPVSNINIQNRNLFYASISESHINLENIRREIKSINSRHTAQIKINHSVNNTTRIEDIITKLWENVLNLDHIDPDDKFFEIGGNSIHIPEIAIRLQKEYGIKIKIVHVFQYPTVRELAKFVGSKKLY